MMMKGAAEGQSRAVKLKHLFEVADDRLYRRVSQMSKKRLERATSSGSSASICDYETHCAFKMHNKPPLDICDPPLAEKCC